MKMIHRELNDFDLKTKVTTNIKQEDLLDVTLDLNVSFQLYMKVNYKPVYINPNSCHLLLLLSTNSSSKVVLNKHSGFYNSSLSGYKGSSIE